MEIVVCIKQVPDTETRIKLKPDGSGIDTEGIKWIISPYDEFAVEEGLRIKEKLGGTVTIVSLGPKRAIEAIRTALAMGADKAIHLSDQSYETFDTYAQALALARAIRTIPHDIILCGRQAIDDDSAQIPSMIAEFLELPQANFVIKLEVSPDKKAVAYRTIEGGAQEVIEMTLPGVISVTKGINEPRYASLPGIMKAKQKKVDELTPEQIGLDANSVGEKGAKTKILKYALPPERKAGKVIQADFPENVRQLVKLLREEAKII